MERAEVVERGRGRGARRGRRGRGRGRERGQSSIEAGPIAQASRGTHAGGVRTRGGRGGVRTRGGGCGRERPSAHDLVFCGMLENIPEGRALETPLYPKRKRQLPSVSRPSSLAVWSSLNAIVPSDLHQSDEILDSPSPIHSPHPPQEEPTARPASLLEEVVSAPSPATYLECGGNGASTPRGTENVESEASTSRGTGNVEVSRKRASQPQDDGSMDKRRLLPSSSSSSEIRRPLRDAEISLILNYGSEEDNDDDDDDEDNEIVTTVLIPRVARPYLLDEENDGELPLLNTDVSYSWPPLPLASSPTTLITSPLPSTSSNAPPPPPSPPRPITPIPLISVSPPPISSPPATHSHNIDKFDFDWRAFPQPQIQPELRREPFSYINCGPTVPLASPYDAFTAIWDREIMEHIAIETNTYAQQLAVVMLDEGTICPSSRITKWHDTDADELYVYLAIVLATGIVIKTRLDEYWNSTQDVFITPGFSASMSINRFLLLSKCIHFQNNESCDPRSMTRAQAKLFKVQPILDHLNNKFSQLYVLSRNIALDESLTMWKGWLDINQFIRNKAAAVGIKTYEVCESQTGYLWRFEVHVGHDTNAESQENNPVSGIVSSIVLRLLNGLENKGHTIWMDNFYNSPALARELKVRGFDCVGTLRTDRQFVPVELTNLKKTDMVVGQVSGCTSGDVDLLVWRHKNRVAFVSTYHGLATTMCDDTLKPTVVADYNICMGGVDRKDQMLAMFPIERKRNRVWYKKFFRRLLNASVLNAFILYRHHHPNTHTHRSFRKSLVRELMAQHGKRPIPTPLIPVPTSGTVGHFPAQYSIKPESAKREHIRRTCAVCKRRTNAYCMACNIPLCVFTCFQSYHTQQ